MECQKSEETEAFVEEPSKKEHSRKSKIFFLCFIFSDDLMVTLINGVGCVNLKWSLKFCDCFK